MKFGATIKGALYPQWQEHYSGLKRLIKDKQDLHPWDDSDEASFLRALEQELDKVVKFQEAKINELTEKIGEYEEEVKELVTRRKRRERRENGGGDDEEATTQDDDGNDEDDEESVGSDDEEAIEDRFVDLEEDLANVIADVHDLGHFSHLNYTGFIKIVKKHDKKTGFALRGQFIRDFLSKRPFYKENYDAIIVQLSRLYNLVRTRGNPVMGDSAAGAGQNAFVRQTTKYWVHPDNFVQLKLVILKHLPVLVFNPDKQFEQADAAISSIYYDNEDLELYLGRLVKSEGAEAIRMRWYGGMDVDTIFVERKTHREDWTGEKSVKARFPLKEHLLNDYLAGKHDVTPAFEQIRKKGKKSDKEVDGMIKLAREIQDTVRIKALKPVMRTFYNRTAFQLPGDARVRISFDTQLTLVREDSLDGTSRALPNWRRSDAGIDYPFDNVRSEDKEFFPYGVLEVKLQTQMGQEPPEWVRDLVSSHLVEAVPKFSKFIHGCATLLPNRVDLVPFWLPQMETDIRKPATQKASIQRPSGSNSHTQSSQTPSEAPSSSRGDVDERYTEPVSDDEMEEEDRHHAVAVDEAGWADLPAAAIAEAQAFRDRNVANDAKTSPDQAKGKNAKSPKQHEIFPKLTPAKLSEMLDSKLILERDRRANGDADGLTAGEAARRGGDTAVPGGMQFEPGRIEYVSSFRAQAGKRVAIPVRVEPKVYYANERTMLSWIEFSVVVSAIGIGIISYSDPHDDIALAAAASFTAVALLAILYTATMFLVRVRKIRRRSASSYHDWFGPSLLCGVLLVAVVVNLSLRLRAGV